jgi:hypothetical protein
VNSDTETTLQRALRDLAWSIESPSLIDTQSPLVPSTHETDWESHRKALPQSLCSPPNHRVGKYFENLIQFWLQEVLSTRIIAQNLQIIEEGKTKGELDFIFQKNDEGIIHWETAVKFYLYHESETVLGSHYIGPNTNDTFERKLDRLFNYQLPLGSIQKPEIDRHEAHVKGRIFYHPNQKQPSQVPTYLSHEHGKGTWIHSSDWRRYAENSPQCFYQIIRKPFWLSPEKLTSPAFSEVFDIEAFHEKLKTHFRQSQHGLLVAAFDSDASGALEQERLFIVDDHWPTTAES